MVVDPTHILVHPRVVHRAHRLKSAGLAHLWKRWVDRTSLAYLVWWPLLRNDNQSQFGIKTSDRPQKNRCECIGCYSEHFLLQYISMSSKSRGLANSSTSYGHGQKLYEGTTWQKVSVVFACTTR